MKFCSLPTLLFSPPLLLYLAVCWYLGLICACFGFKHKINSEEVSRGHWPGQSRSKVDYWLSCRQHGLHIGTIGDLDITSVLCTVWEPITRFEMWRRGGSQCSIEKPTHIHSHDSNLISSPRNVCWGNVFHSNKKEEADVWILNACF